MVWIWIKSQLDVHTQSHINSFWIIWNKIQNITHRKHIHIYRVEHKFVVLYKQRFTVQSLLEWSKNSKYCETTSNAFFPRNQNGCNHMFTTKKIRKNLSFSLSEISSLFFDYPIVINFVGLLNLISSHRRYIDERNNSHKHFIIYEIRNRDSTQTHTYGHTNTQQ